MTKQQRWQNKQRQLGRCVICGKEAKQKFCAVHIANDSRYRRERRQTQKLKRLEGDYFKGIDACEICGSKDSLIAIPAGNHAALICKAKCLNRVTGYGPGHKNDVVMEIVGARSIVNS